MLLLVRLQRGVVFYLFEEVRLRKTFDGYRRRLVVQCKEAVPSTARDEVLETKAVALTEMVHDFFGFHALVQFLQPRSERLEHFGSRLNIRFGCFEILDLRQSVGKKDRGHKHPPSTIEPT